MKNSFYLSPGSDDAASNESATQEAAQTDSTKLTIAALYISPDGGDTNEEYPQPGVEYDFVANVVNTGTENTGSFFVKFQFNPESENPNPGADLTVTQEDGLDPRASMRAVSHFGAFPNEHNTYHLEACIYDASAPETPITCTSFDFFVNTAD